jgi:hypothetical protein
MDDTAAENCKKGQSLLDAHGLPQRTDVPPPSDANLELSARTPITLFDSGCEFKGDISTLMGVVGTV